jgi:hypothetical protein
MMRKHRFLGFLIIAVVLLGLTVLQISPKPVFADASEEAQPQEIESCLACHTDKDALVSTAKVEEAVASENEGEG